MSQRGRKPQPTALRLVKGNPGRRPLPANEPKPQPGIPEKPDWLKGEAAAEWDRVVPEHDGKTHRVVESSMGSRRQPLMLAITTAGFDHAGFDSAASSTTTTT